MAKSKLIDRTIGSGHLRVESSSPKAINSIIGLKSTQVVRYRPGGVVNLGFHWKEEKRKI